MQSNALPVRKVLLVVSPFPDQLQLPLTGTSSELLEQLCLKDKTQKTVTKNRKFFKNPALIKEFSDEQTIAESPLWHF